MPTASVCVSLTTCMYVLPLNDFDIMFSTYYTAVGPKKCHLNDFCNVDMDMQSTSRLLNFNIYMNTNTLLEQACRCESLTSRSLVAVTGKINSASFNVHVTTVFSAQRSRAQHEIPYACCKPLRKLRSSPVQPHPDTITRP